LNGGGPCGVDEELAGDAVEAVEDVVDELAAPASAAAPSASAASTAAAARNFRIDLNIGISSVAWVDGLTAALKAGAGNSREPAERFLGAGRAQSTASA
jgi:hypothetical protein